MQDVCRCLEVDLTGQTSASYNMRLNYEKCLHEFESYLASGQFAAELAAGSAPTYQSLGHSFAKPAMIVGAGVPSTSAGPSRLGQSSSAAAAVFTPFNAAAAAPSAPSPGTPRTSFPPAFSDCASGMRGSCLASFALHAQANCGHAMYIISGCNV